MSEFSEVPFTRREGKENSKPLGNIEMNCQKREYYIPNEGVPDLYVEGISEPIIKVEVDFTPGQGWRAADLIENNDPVFQDIINKITVDGGYKNYAEEVESYINYLNKEKPNGIEI